MKGRGELQWLIVSSVWFRSCSDFYWFCFILPRRSREQQSGSHRENWHRRWGNDGKEPEMKQTQEQNRRWQKNESQRVSVWKRFTYIRALSSVSGCSPRVDVKADESHTGKWAGRHLGLTPRQGRGCSLRMYLSRRPNDGLRSGFSGLTLKLWEINTRLEVGVASHTRAMHHRTHTQP